MWLCGMPMCERLSRFKEEFRRVNEWQVQAGEKMGQLFRLMNNIR